jgi:uncharacterized protein YndB with AHSA1/START domain
MMQVVSRPKVTVRREIKALVEEIFDAWLDPGSLALWMRPGGIPRSTAKVDPREGGTYEIVMHHTSGPLVHTGVYRVIDRPKRLVFTWFSDATRHTESLVTVEFHARHGTTEVVVTHEQLPDEGAVPSHTDGWTQALDLLAAELGSARTA